MRVIVYFDLPVLTASDMKEYRKFRTYLLKTGFIMEQESVYSKLALNGNAAKFVSHDISNHAPPKGVVELLTVTEKQYSNINYITGEMNSEYINTTDRLVLL